jgi:hypothetical protein
MSDTTWPSIRSGFVHVSFRPVRACSSFARVRASNGGFDGFLKRFLTGGFAVVTAMSDLETAAKEVDATAAEVERVGIMHRRIR